MTDTERPRQSQPTRTDLRPTDGRIARSERTRQQIIDACTTLISTGFDPTARIVAIAADCGLRTVFQHFPAMTDLHAACGYDRVVTFAPLREPAIAS